MVIASYLTERKKTCFFLLEKKAIRDLYLGSIKENTERRALDFAVPHIAQKIKNHIQKLTIGPENIPVAKNKAQQMIKT